MFIFSKPSTYYKAVVYHPQTNEANKSKFKTLFQVSQSDLTDSILFFATPISIGIWYLTIFYCRRRHPV